MRSLAWSKRWLPLAAGLALWPLLSGCPGVIELKSKSPKGPSVSTVAPILYDDFEKGFSGGWNYADTDGGASCQPSEETQVVYAGKKAMKVAYKTGVGSWGCGFGWATPYLPKEGYFNAKGTLGVEMYVKAGRGITFQLSVKEGNSNGGDGEVYLAPQGTGTGLWKRYFFPYDSFTKGTYSGNQAGDDEFEISSIVGMDVQLSEKQGDGALYIDNIYFK